MKQVNLKFDQFEVEVIELLKEYYHIKLGKNYTNKKLIEDLLNFSLLSLAKTEKEELEKIAKENGLDYVVHWMKIEQNFQSPKL